MSMEIAKLCPFCMHEVIEMGKNGYGRCKDFKHGWVKYVKFALLPNQDQIQPKGIIKKEN